jgi:hypothetical protein
LQVLVDDINRLTGSPLKPWTRQADGTMKANIGNYHLSGAYGGVCLHQMSNESGGVRTPLSYGHVPKRELYGMLQAFISGLQAKGAQ